MEKVCCEFKRSDGLEVKWVETDEGFRIEVKGDKDRLKDQMMGSCCIPFGRVDVTAKGGSCC